MQTDLSDSSFFNHKSVMTDEIIASLEHYPLIHNNQLKGIDATLGGGGHSYHLLRKYSDLNIIGLDQDPFARKSASTKLLYPNPLFFFTPTISISHLLILLSQNISHFPSNPFLFS